MSADAPFLRTLAPLLRGLERHFRAWLDGRRVWPVSMFQRAEMEGVLADIKRKADALDVEKPSLVIMLMGGTGVGKSTLLNALAGSPIAQSSFTRPTTRDPVVYHHHSLSPEKLDPALRVCRLVGHDREPLAQKILVDTPDLDSNDLANREKLINLLPVADIVLYVGSQEKYHDRLGWDLFKAQRQRRAFAFVLNKWDRCLESSASGLRPDNDLLRDLKDEGFQNPKLFRTTAQAWLDSRGETPANLVPGEQFRELVDWLELGLTRREIEAVKARGVAQLLAQGQAAVERVTPPVLGAEADRVKAAWPPILAAEGEVAAEVLAGSLDPAGSEIEQHFALRGQQRYRGLMAAWLRLTSLRFGVRNLIRTPLPSLPRIGLGDRPDSLNFQALADSRTHQACEKILKERSQSLGNRLLVEADQRGLPIALLNDRVANVQNRDWRSTFSLAVADTLVEVENEILRPSGMKALFRGTMTFIANYLPEAVLLASLGVVIWLFTVDGQLPGLSMMLMPVYTTLGTLIFLQLLMGALFPVRWARLRSGFRKLLEARLKTDYETAYVPLADDVAGQVAKEREALEHLANEVKQVADWLSEKETASKVSELYGK